MARLGMPLPGNPFLDQTRAMRRDPYRFVASRCHHHGSDVIELRLRLRRTICMRGPAAAELFSDSERFVRRGPLAAHHRPALLARGGVRELDGPAHAARKALFLPLTTRSEVTRLAAGFEALLAIYAARWELRGEASLEEQLREVLARCAFAWAGVRMDADEVALRAADLTRLFEPAGCLRARLRASRRAQRWAAEQVRSRRAQAEAASVGFPATRVALHRDPSGDLLPVDVAAVELLNVLRPIVVVSGYLVFVAHALAQQPGARERLLAEADYLERFVLEVRRYYPLVPAIDARVRRGFEWRGYAFPRGRRVLLDLYGTHHDPRVWKRPELFDPDRFKGWIDDGFSLVPHGPGEAARDHRCPGEAITVELMRSAARFLTRDVSYELPEQDLTIDFSRVPARPYGGLRVRNVRLFD